MQIRPLLRRTPVYLLPLAVLLLAAAARLAVPDLLDRLSLVCFDVYQRAVPRDPSEAPIRIVDIDDASLAELGQWPWPRGLVAELIGKLRDAGAAVVVFDIDFAESDRTSARMLLPLMTRNGVDAQEAEKLLAALPDPDRRLADAMGTVPVVTGFIMTDRPEARLPDLKAGFAFAGNDPLGHVERFAGAIANLPAFEAAAAGNGFLNQYVEWDHVVRRVPLILTLGGKPYPSLAAEALRLASGARSYVGRAAGASGETGFGEHSGLTAIRIGPLTVPTDAAGRVWLHFAAPRSDRRVSAADVLGGKFDPRLFAGNIVLVGTSAKGVINDDQATPIARNVPGVEIHAQLIEQILQQSFLTRPDWAMGAETLFTVLAGLGLILVLPRIGALLSAGLGAACVIAAFGASWLAFTQAQLLIDPVYPWVVITLIYLLASLLGYLRTEARQRQVRRTFSQYMSPHYVEELARHPERLKLGGQMRPMTIMFCDIRGFTSLSEHLDAESLTHFMNSFLSPMTEIITEHKGTIDKYIGDCIMAFWNAPLDDPEHARNAVRAAQAMRRELVDLNRRWEGIEAYRTFFPVRIGIGINTGECVVGNFGSEAHFDYSLLGDPVNVAARLEGLGKVYGVDLVIGEETAAQLDRAALIELDLVAVKGKTQAGHIFTLPPDQPDQDQPDAGHSELLAAYRRQDWAAALRLLDGRLAAARHLSPVYDLYRKRIARFQHEAPPGDWNGVFTAEEK